MKMIVIDDVVKKIGTVKETVIAKSMYTDYNYIYILHLKLNFAIF